MGQQHINVLTLGNKTNVTVLASVSASGYVVPSMVFHKCKSLTPELTCGEIAGRMYGLSSIGWIEAELFSEWFLRHFLEQAQLQKQWYFYSIHILYTTVLSLSVKHVKVV